MATMSSNFYFAMTTLYSMFLGYQEPNHSLIEIGNEKKIGTKQIISEHKGVINDRFYPHYGATSKRRNSNSWSRGNSHRHTKETRTQRTLRLDSILKRAKENSRD